MLPWNIVFFVLSLVTSPSGQCSVYMINILLELELKWKSCFESYQNNSTNQNQSFQKLVSKECLIDFFQSSICSKSLSLSGKFDITK